MANRNTVPLGYVGGSIAGQIAQLSLAATTETAFKLTAASGTPTAFLTIPVNTGIYGSASVIDASSNQSFLGDGGGSPGGRTRGQGAPFATNFDNDRPFKVRVSGYGNAGANAAQSVIVNLYQGTSATLGSDTKIATTGAALATVAGGAYSYIIEATCQWDSTLQLLTGYFTACINFASKAGSQFTTQAILSNYATVTTAAGLSFLASVTMGNAAASTANVTEFSAETI